MYSFKELQDEICAKIEWLKQNNGETLSPDWITQAVMKDHANISGPDVDFHTSCTRFAVRKEVTQQLNKTDTPVTPGEPRQLTLEGYEYVQRYYVIKRGGERTAVRVDALTREEGTKKAHEYIRMGDECKAHGEELLRYLDDRKASA